MVCHLHRAIKIIIHQLEMQRLEAKSMQREIN